MDDLPIAYQAWEELAGAYSERVATKDYNAYYEWPATLSLLPSLESKRVLDAGCGPGVYAEILVERGAEVVGFDRSPKMVALARQRLQGSAEILQADMRHRLEFAGDEEFHIVLSSLALEYVADWRPVFFEFYRVLRPDGVLVFSAGHPCYHFCRFQDQANYFQIEVVEETWTGFGFAIDMPFYRRPLSEMIDPLLAAGFRLEKVLEPRPLPEFKAAKPEDYERLMVQPCFICLRARKP